MRAPQWFVHPAETRQTCPDEAGEVEQIVGKFDMERASGTLLTAEEFNEYSMIRRGDGARHLSQEEILRVRARRGALFKRWEEVPRGETLELQFARSLD
jgi:hypothetical protein